MHKLHCRVFFMIIATSPFAFASPSRYLENGPLPQPPCKFSLTVKSENDPFPHQLLTPRGLGLLDLNLGYFNPGRPSTSRLK
jgi:hypothetical protein